MNAHAANEGNPLGSASSKSSDDASNVGTGQPRPGDDEGAPVLSSSPILSYSSSEPNPSLQPFLEGLHHLGLVLTQQQLDQFLQYRQELLDWNTRINLTAISDPDEVLTKHFLDSLSLLL